MSKTKTVLGMHRYVLGLTGVMALIGITLPIAIWRVSSTQKFAGQPFHSQTCTAQQPTKLEVVSWLATCRHMQMEPLPSPAQKSQAHP
jgi:hypothetical protein